MKYSTSPEDEQKNIELIGINSTPTLHLIHAIPPATENTTENFRTSFIMKD